MDTENWDLGEERMDEKTRTYYQENAAAYAQSTYDVDFEDVRRQFLQYLKPGSRILDLGCGSGRDARAFLELGYAVTAVDGSEELCRIASANTGLRVQQMWFQDLAFRDAFDGIWACSSILHLSRPELKEVFQKIHSALSMEGVLYTSFKYGTFEGERSGRYFCDFTEQTFAAFLEEIDGMGPAEVCGPAKLHGLAEACGPAKRFELIKQWVSADVRPGRTEEKWLNLILRKESI